MIFLLRSQRVCARRTGSDHVPVPLGPRRTLTCLQTMSFSYYNRSFPLLCALIPLHFKGYFYSNLVEQPPDTMPLRWFAPVSLHITTLK